MYLGTAEACTLLAAEKGKAVAPFAEKNKNRIKVGTKTKLHDYELPYYALKHRTRILDKD